MDIVEDYAYENEDRAERAVKYDLLRPLRVDTEYGYNHMFASKYIRRRVA